ncbi:hypothetical protein D4R42_01215 [bacterium]|nr:MAG: hypothetical protein D4R42_01215 [bacterium]
MKLERLDKLFEIQHGNKFDLNKMEIALLKKDTIAFVGRSANNNGISAFVKSYNDVEPFPSGYITVALGGSALSSFVQPRHFYTAQNVDVLKPLTNMTLDMKLYYCKCIEANRFRYSTFGREANRTLHTLLVPNLESIPSWVNGSINEAFAEVKTDLASMIEQ